MMLYRRGEQGRGPGRGGVQSRRQASQPGERARALLGTVPHCRTDTLEGRGRLQGGREGCWRRHGLLAWAAACRLLGWWCAGPPHGQINETLLLLAGRFQGWLAGWCMHEVPPRAYATCSTWWHTRLQLVAGAVHHSGPAWPCSSPSSRHREQSKGWNGPEGSSS